MTAKEKAKQLIEKIENIELIQTGYEDFHIDSKEVALLCINEQMKMLRRIGTKSAEYEYSDLKDVHAEIAQNKV